MKTQSVSLTDFRSYCKKLQAQIEQNFENFSKKYNDHNETFMKQINQAIQKRKQETADLKKDCQSFQAQISESMDIVQHVKQSQDSFRAENNKKLTTCFREMERIQTQVLSKVNHDEMQSLSKKMAEKTYVNQQLTLLVTRQQQEQGLQNKVDASEFHMHLNQMKQNMSIQHEQVSDVVFKNLQQLIAEKIQSIKYELMDAASGST